MPSDRLSPSLGRPSQLDASAANAWVHTCPATQTECGCGIASGWSCRLHGRMGSQLAQRLISSRQRCRPGWSVVFRGFHTGVTGLGAGGCTGGACCSDARSGAVPLSSTTMADMLSQPAVRQQHVSWQPRVREIPWHRGCASGCAGFLRCRTGSVTRAPAQLCQQNHTLSFTAHRGRSHWCWARGKRRTAPRRSCAAPSRAAALSAQSPPPAQSPGRSFSWLAQVMAFD